MSGQGPTIARRPLLGAAAAAGLAYACPTPLSAAAGAPITKTIPASGAAIPAIGMGTWIEFDVGRDRGQRQVSRQILGTFLARGGGLVDSSPMYGSAREVLGWCLEGLNDTAGLLPADKVWSVPGTGGAEAQMAESRRLWGRERFTVMQVHNLVDWQRNLPVLRAAKEAGWVRSIGVTTSHGRRHGELEEIMAREPIDFVQLTYNITDRWAEERLLPLAEERGIAVIANRPFKRKALFRRYQDQPLPSWAPAEADAHSWAEFFLKFIVSHPAVTCAIPATSQPAHMRENMAALYGRLPDAKTRARMAAYVASL